MASRINVRTLTRPRPSPHRDKCCIRIWTDDQSRVHMYESVTSNFPYHPRCCSTDCCYDPDRCLTIRASMMVVSMRMMPYLCWQINMTWEKSHTNAVPSRASTVSRSCRQQSCQESKSIRFWDKSMVPYLDNCTLFGCYAIKDKWAHVDFGWSGSNCLVCSWNKMKNCLNKYKIFLLPHSTVLPIEWIGKWPVFAFNNRHECTMDQIVVGTRIIVQLQ